ncbi:hypothetical protein ACFU76_18705 [Streptomyces sp. NPDC057539]|uniref:hypothetical protein n=1 Tax=Streptomyces sp. NPDC057539 TaxID=3346159 RepID=UPI0036CD0128
MSHTRDGSAAWHVAAQKAEITALRHQVTQLALADAVLTRQGQNQKENSEEAEEAPDNVVRLHPKEG